MPRNSHAYRLTAFMALLALSFALVTVYFREGDRGGLHGTQRWLGDAFAPASGVVQRVGRAGPGGGGRRGPPAVPRRRRLGGGRAAGAARPRPPAPGERAPAQAARRHPDRRPAVGRAAGGARLREVAAVPGARLLRAAQRARDRPLA